MNKSEELYRSAWVKFRQQCPDQEVLHKIEQSCCMAGNYFESCWERAKEHWKEEELMYSRVRNREKADKAWDERVKLVQIEKELGLAGAEGCGLGQDEGKTKLRHVEPFYKK